MIDFRGRTALVTGASGGLGRAIVRNLAMRGATIIATDKAPSDGMQLIDQLVETRHRGAWVTFDLSNLSSIKAFTEDILSVSNGLDFLVNNAAHIPRGPLTECSQQEIELAHTVNLIAPLLLCKHLKTALGARRGSAIVNIASNTLSGGWEDFIPYVTTKGGLVGMTRSMAREFGESGVRVNAVSPGAIPTEAEDRVFGERKAEYEKFLIERQALKRRGTADEIADVVAFLLSEMASFVTGQNIVADGGVFMK